MRTLHKQNIPCQKCGANNVRLFRDYGKFFQVDHVCGPCLEAEGHTNHHPDVEFGTWEYGWWVPMIPCETDSAESAWARSAMPAVDLYHWYSLPQRPDETLSVTRRNFRSYLKSEEKQMLKYKRYAREDDVRFRDTYLEAYATLFSALKETYKALEAGE